MRRRPVPKPRQQVRRNEPDKQEADERRTPSRGLQQRPSMSRELGGIRENGQVRERAPNLGTRPGRENMSGAVRKLLERQAASDVMLLQRGRSTFAVTVASTHEAHPSPDREWPGTARSDTVRLLV